MTTKRTLRTHKLAHPITDAAIEAFKAGDWLTMRDELHLPPWCWGNDLIEHPFGHTDQYGREYLPWYRREDVRDALLDAVAASEQLDAS